MNCCHIVLIIHFDVELPERFFFLFGLIIQIASLFKKEGVFFNLKKKMAVDGILFASRVKMSLKTLMQQIVEREREKSVLVD